MTNVFKTVEKVERKDRLFEIGVQTLQKQGWTISREKGLGKASVRRITKEGTSKLVSIRTTQDQWIAFPPKPDGDGWITLDNVDVVLAVSVDDRDSPKAALVHWIDAAEMRDRFNRAAKARRKAGHHVSEKRRGVWLPLYHQDDGQTVRFVGGGAGIDYPPIAREPLNGGDGSPPRNKLVSSDSPDEGHPPLTILQAKRGLALSFGVPESAIKISIEA